MKELIIERLKRFVRAKYPTAKSLADDLGMSPQALQSSYLSGRSLPGGELLVKLHLLGLDINWLLTGHGIPPDPTPAELDVWIEQTLKVLDYWRDYRALQRKAEDTPFLIAAEPAKPYDTSKRKKKK